MGIITAPVRFTWIPQWGGFPTRRGIFCGLCNKVTKLDSIWGSIAGCPLFWATIKIGKRNAQNAEFSCSGKVQVEGFRLRGFLGTNRGV